MNEWQEVKAWEALKALQEGTHDVQYTTSSTNSSWTSWSSFFVSGEACHHRIRPKVRTVDVIGLPVPLHVSGVYCVVVKLDDKYQDVFRYSCDYKTEAEARRAYEALCAASK